MFFDNILVYSKSLQDHVKHLSRVFEIGKSNHLILNGNKCHFATDRVEYLVYFISQQWISTDPYKL